MEGVDTLYVINEYFKNIESTSSEVNFWKENLIYIIGFVEILLLGLYVFYTKSTFEEIKKQTDLQLRAYLDIDSLILPSKAEGNLIDKYYDNEFSGDWKGIMETTFPELDNSEIFEGNYYALRISNFGNSPVKAIKIKATVTVSNSERIIEEKKLKEKEVKEFEAIITQLVKASDTYMFYFFSTASFPNFKIIADIEYTDIRNQKYIIKGISLEESNSHLN